VKGWWSGGFGYGLWIGVLVASGFSVVPVPSLLWKNEFELSGRSSPKVGLILASRTSMGFSHCYLMQLYLSWKWSWLIYHCVNMGLLNLRLTIFLFAFDITFNHFMLALSSVLNCLAIFIFTSNVTLSASFYSNIDAAFWLNRTKAGELHPHYFQRWVPCWKEKRITVVLLFLIYLNGNLFSVCYDWANGT
jgi:hypothetical protein